MRQGIPHLGTKGNTSHPDCALFLLADCPGRGSSLPMSGSEVEVFWAPTDASIGSAGSTLSSPVVSVFIARTSVKRLSTGPCMGLSSRVVVTVALRDRGHAFGRKPIPVGYALPTEGRPTGPDDSPERKASELLLPLQRLLLTSAMANRVTRLGSYGAKVLVTNFT